MLKWFTKKKDEKEKPKTKSLARMSVPLASEPQIRSSNLKIKKKVVLPRNFAKKVIDLEIQCDRPDVTRDHINTLMDLYTVNFINYIIYFYNRQPSSITIASAILTIRCISRQSCILS
jgi:hypothetical protein